MNDYKPLRSRPLRFSIGPAIAPPLPRRYKSSSSDHADPYAPSSLWIHDPSTSASRKGKEVERWDYPRVESLHRQRSPSANAQPCCCERESGEGGRPSAAGSFDGDEHDFGSDTSSVPSLSPCSSTASSSSSLYEPDDVDCYFSRGPHAPIPRLGSHARLTPLTPIHDDDDDDKHSSAYSLTNEALFISPSTDSLFASAVEHLPRAPTTCAPPSRRKPTLLPSLILSQSLRAKPTTLLISPSTPPSLTTSLQSLPSPPSPPVTRLVANSSEMLITCIELNMIRKHKIVCPLHQRATILRKGAKTMEGSHLKEVIVAGSE
ncbi:hypothetical protein MNV49_005591 [Pseudohyphozyma bogoriensis]|nr:hypothetical protein MNV49_005591 [Pseudohyphozyma bogoriensis]